MSQPHSLCFYCNYVSRPQKYVATSFLLSSFLLLGHNFSFMLRHHSVVLSFQAGRDSKLLVCFFSYRGVDIRSQPSIFFITAILVATSKVCRDHPFFLSSRNLISQSQQFPFNFSISGRDLDLMLQHEFLLPTMLIFVVTMFF